jgi:hypothetical protein
METWKVVRGFSDYAVSTLGRVMRIKALERTKVGKILTPYPSKAGYLYVTLHRDHKRYSVLLHRLVAIAFVPNPHGRPEVNHKRTKKDCRASQLEWLTKKQHTLDKMKRKQQRYKSRTPRRVNNCGMCRRRGCPGGCYEY